MRALRIRVRLSWRDEDLTSRDRGETVAAASGEIVGGLPSRTRITLRYDVARYVDTRESTLVRSPNPEQWVRVDLEQRF